MKEFFESIYSKFSEEPNNSFYTLLSGRMSYGEADEDCMDPYAVFFGLPCVPNDTFTEKINEVYFQINIYSSDKDDVFNAIEPCLSLFDGVTLEVANHKDIKLNRELVTPPWKNDLMWCVSIEFSGLLQNN